MTQARPSPDAATPASPAQAEPQAALPPTIVAAPGRAAEPGRDTRLSTGAKVGIGAAAVGIGSAAIAAALLYANRDRKPSSRR